MLRQHCAERVREFLAIGIPLMEEGAAVECYARICTQLQCSGEYGGIGQICLWIAAVTLSQGLPLVTRNQRHFAGIDGLKLEVVG